jgi:hypothetical protein
VVLHGTTVQLNASNSSDPENDILTYSWSQLSGPEVSLSDPTESNPTFTSTSGESHLVFRLIVNDGITDSEPDTIEVTVLDAIYVSEAADDSGFGTKENPMPSISSAINFGVSMGANVNILVSAGIYREYLVMAEGISIYGGYDPVDWSRDINTNITTIHSLGPVEMSIDDKCVIWVSGGITSETTIDGFLISGAKNGILNESSSPIISRNRINGKSGIYNKLGSSPIIEKNFINSMDSTGLPSCKDLKKGGSCNAFSYGIYNYQSSPVIRNNIINAEKSNVYSFGILNSDSSAIIRNNIIAGDMADKSAGILITNSESGNSPVIENNIIYTKNGGSRYCIYENQNPADPISLRNNNLFDCPDGLYADYVESGGNCENGQINCFLQIEDVNDYLNTTQDPVKLSSGNISTSPGFANVPEFYDYTVGLGSKNTIILSDTSSYLSGDYVEINEDNVARLITVFDTKTIVIDPVMDSPSTGGMLIKYWGQNNSDFIEDYHMTILSPVNIRKGGLDGSSGGWKFLDDLEGNERTGFTGCTIDCPVNADAAGWSLGVYEMDDFK